MWPLSLWSNPKREPASDKAEPAPSNPPAGDRPCPRCEKQEAALREALSYCRNQILRRIANAKQVSEREVIASATSVDQIVKETEEYIRESKAILSGMLTEQRHSFDVYLAEAKEALRAQRRVVQEALSLSDSIAKAGGAVESLAHHARMLSLNAKIEAARLGASGKAFDVITSEMRDLSQEISKANHLITETTQSIRECLPSIMGQTESQVARLEAFSAQMSQLKEQIEASLSATGSAGDSRLEKIINLSHATLSHLQFQDPMVQDLEKIQLDLAALQAALIPADPTTTQPTVSPKTTSAPPSAEAASPHAGEVLLFE